MSTVVAYQTLDMSDANCGFTDYQLMDLLSLMRAEMFPSEVSCISEIRIISRGNDELYGEYAVFMIHSKIGAWVESFSATVFFTSPKESELVCLTER
jgi:hypothetical protein